MNAFMGADTDDVRDLATRFSQGSQRLQELRETAEAFVRAVTWIGPDADKFQDRASSVLADLAARASDVSDRARTMETEAEEQDSASSPEINIPSVGASVGAGAGAWQPGAGTLPDIGKWLSDGSEKDDAAKRAGDIVRRMVDKEIDKAVDILEWANGGPGWLRGAKKAIPAVPDAIDFANHAAHGETVEAEWALIRGAASVTPVGLVDDASAVAFPMMPDDWKYPDSDVSLNEGSIFDGLEKAALEDKRENHVTQGREDGEQHGMDISDRLGIENEYARNTFKTVGGILGGADASRRNPDGTPYYPWQDGDHNPWN